jgi:opacity protein-like surface antigen
MLMIGFGGSSTENTYGLALNDSTTAANPSLNGPRTTETKNGSTFMLGIQGFAGVEWFFAPKVSLGAEYTWDYL